jgi:sRNA-binding protein
VFVADRWRKHKALARGIHLELVARGILTAKECRALFRFYTARLMYQRCLSAGGARFDLDGQVSGEITPEEMAGASKRVAQIEAKRAERYKAMRAEREAERAAQPAQKAAAIARSTLSAFLD